MGFDWAFFIERIVNPGEPYLNALARTVTMAVLAMLLGLLIGLVVGFGRLSRYAAVRAACGGVAGAVKRDLTFLLPFLVTARFSGRHDST